MKIVITGGTGQVGRILSRALVRSGHQVVVLSRGDGRGLAPGVRHESWDGRTQGAWTKELDGCDAVINLAGRSVSCRYSESNLRAMMDLRVDSTRAVGEAIEQATTPPRVWLQMSTATIYAHRFDAPNDEATGIIGGTEPDVPGYWAFSVEIAKAWERTQDQADTPHTRSVALRTAMVMSPDRGGVFDVMLRMVRLGLGGPVAGGAQYVSWIHEQDMVRAVDLLIGRDDLAGPVNLAAPEPLPHRDFIRALRSAWGTRLGLPATRWMAELGAFVIRTDTELLLKSRRVVPGRLRDAGFSFDFPHWAGAAEDLVRRVRAERPGQTSRSQLS
ncbi:TIGR01777 family oxidoreductase [Actinopolymorpha sp. B17G11]|uniref:TIGR01777 family oxidoreductase n=1 Tax=Actinopolymorpha sp. B17G11 TaxID=3160861 RepID=UPI0032E48BA4